MTVQTVAVAVDGSEANRGALDWAVDHAATTGADLVVTTVAEPYQVIGGYVPETPPSDYLKPVAKEAADHARATLPAERVRAVIETGHPVAVLQEVAEERDLLVVGKRGRGAIGRLVMGSTSIAVAGRAHTPVVVVPVGWDASAHADAPVVVGVDVDKDHAAGLRFAFEAARTRGVPLRAVQVWEPHPALVAETAVFVQAFDDWRGEVATEFKKRLDGLAEEFPGVDVELVQIVGQPVHHLLEEAESAQLLVLGRDAKDRLSGFTLGSVARGVLHHSEVPVAVVPAS
ncbi:universal stress protein [Nocardioides sp. Y6]|uniref:Universal stress protein n=1 Tax=Nocardioides malaquae TaxID=2773426 RepID=A0ABR9RR49_9ACTN|nr:universal stress protein [Nocardioides malaquae]MBE7324055.1 universal stress protein [Nocardioides malaquae]